MSFLSRLRDGLTKTRSLIQTSLDEDGGTLDDSFYTHIEEALIRADIGVEFTDEILGILRERVQLDRVGNPAEAYEAMKKIIAAGLSVRVLPDDFPAKPWVVLVVGVNGVGKTTTIGKLAHRYANQGKSVVLAAADTFRAGAIEQLRIWAERTNSAFVSQQVGADPASVAFDAMEAARLRGHDVCILDTAGRLHNKVNPMNELEKIMRVVKRNTPTAPNEVLLVIDATTGQNALKQAQEFNRIVGITGLIITKLDGTAKGGIALSLTKKLGIPIQKIGVGEGIDDLQDFQPVEYVEAMFGDLAGKIPNATP